MKISLIEWIYHKRYAVSLHKKSKPPWDGLIVSIPQWLTKLIVIFDRGVR